MPEKRIAIAAGMQVEKRPPRVVICCSNPPGKSKADELDLESYGSLVRPHETFGKSDRRAKTFSSRIAQYRKDKERDDKFGTMMTVTSIISNH